MTRPLAPTSSELAPLYQAHLEHLDAGYALALAESGLDGALVHSGSLKSRSAFDDQYWPLRVTPHFQHWLPLGEPGCALLIRPGRRPTLYWLRESNFWERPAPPPGSHWQGSFDVVELGSPEALAGVLPGATARLAFIGEDERVAAALGLAERMNPPALMKALDRLRTIKTRYEIACLVEANRVAALGHRRVADAFASDEPVSELDLHLLYLRATEQDDPETPYKNIVAFDANAATLHHVSYGRSRPSVGDPRSLLLDAGATFMGYASDITRTYVRGRGEAAAGFAALVAGVERLQQRLCSEARVGQPYEALHDRSHEAVGLLLVELGLAKVSAEEVVSSGLTRVFLPHGLGHSLGLQTHDVGCAEVRPRADNPFLRNTSTIASGQVFTIEPGVYFIESLLAPVRTGPRAASIDWKLVDALGALGGVRIEDDLVVGDAGLRNLTREHLPT